MKLGHHQIVTSRFETPTDKVSRPLIASTVSIWVSKRTSRRKLPRVKVSLRVSSPPLRGELRERRIGLQRFGIRSLQGQIDRLGAGRESSMLDAFRHSEYLSRPQLHALML